MTGVWRIRKIVLTAFALSCAGVAAAQQIAAPVEGLAGAIWADLNNDGHVDGYVRAGQYYPGRPAGMVSPAVPSAPAAKPWLGVGLQALDPAIAVKIPLEPGQGEQIRSLVPNGPAERAGLHSGDVIIAIGKSRVTTAEPVPILVSRLTVGQAAQVGYYRDGAFNSVMVTPQARPTEQQLAQMIAPPIEEAPALPSM